jgi:hypothetical protein
MAVLADSLPDDAGRLKAMLIAERIQNERLRQIIKELQRHRFGRRTETLPEDQMLLGLEEVEQVAASNEAQIQTANPAEQASRATKRRMNRGSLPAHRPRIEMVVDIESHTCPCCGNALHRIGEDTGERLDIVPAQFRVLVVRRPKYGCRCCENVVVQAAAPARLIEGGLPTSNQQNIWRVRDWALTAKAGEHRGAAQCVPRDQDNASAHFGKRLRSDFASPRCTTGDDNSLAPHEHFYCRDQFYPIVMSRQSPRRRFDSNVCRCARFRSCTGVYSVAN